MIIEKHILGVLQAKRTGKRKKVKPLDVILGQEYQAEQTWKQAKMTKGGSFIFLEHDRRTRMQTALDTRNIKTRN